jgi:hypothetical protein
VASQAAALAGAPGLADPAFFGGVVEHVLDVLGGHCRLDHWMHDILLGSRPRS